MSHTQGRISIGTDFVTLRASGGATSTAKILDKACDESGRVVALVLDRVIHRYDSPFEDPEDGYAHWNPTGCFATELTRA